MRLIEQSDTVRFAAALLLAAGCSPRRAGPAVEPPAALVSALASAREAYPELAAARVELREMRAEQFFFMAQPEWRHAFRRSGARTYRISYDPAVLADGPSAEALAGVMAHELGHILEYARLGGLGLADFGLRYLCVREFRIAHERDTDFEALVRGFGPGLAAYERWALGRLSGAALRVKRETYLSPEEIEAWVRDKSEAQAGG